MQSNIISHYFLCRSLNISKNLHNKLGHPSLYVLRNILSSHSLFVSSKKSFICNSCSCNKAHKLPFSISSLSSSRPLELVHSNVWGLAPLESIYRFRFYVIFIDHFTKFIWFLPLKHKFDVLTIFVQFKKFVEIFFCHSIKSFYSDKCGEFI